MKVTTTPSELKPMYFFDWKITTVCLTVVLCGVIIYCIRWCFRGVVCQNDTRLDGQTVLITGANSGIGAATAEEMARRGARVIMACRNMFKAERVAFNIVERTGSKQMVVQHLDLASFASIRDFVSRIKSQESRLDILINNAGVGGDPSRRTVEGLEYDFGINHVGHHLLTTLLLDMLKRSAPSRIINVSCNAYKYAGKYDFTTRTSGCRVKMMKAYAKSKLANILFSKELGRRLEGTGIVSMSLDPGYVWTSIYRDCPWYWRILMALSGPIFMKTSTQGAQTTIHCAVLEPTREMVEGRSIFFSDCAQKPLDPIAEDEKEAKDQWEWTERFIADHDV